MRVIDHLHGILAKAIAEPLADVGILLTDDHCGYTVAHYEGREGDFDRTVTVVRDKWWSKNRGRFTIFLGVRWSRCELSSGHAMVPEYAETPLADLMDRESDDWKIWGTDDAEPFIAELRYGMRDCGIPWLQRLSDVESFIQWQKKEGF